MALTGVIKRNIKSLQSNLQANLHYRDLNYKGPKDKTKFVCRDGEAIINAYKLWLISDRGDYCRQPTKGGFLRDNLNRYEFKDSSIPSIEAELRSLSAETFPYIELLRITIKRDVPKRCWILRVAVRDKITGLIGDMGSNGIVVEARV